MRRWDRGTLRSAVFVMLMLGVFLAVNTQVAAAADASGDGSGGLLAPLNVTTSEGAPLDGYELVAKSGGALDFSGGTRILLLGGLFTLVRLLVGLACWMIQFVLRVPLLSMMLQPAQGIADAYRVHVVGVLGLPGIVLSWAFVFGLFLFMRGKVAQGLGEIALTLLIAAFAASAIVRPDYLLAKGGPLDQIHQAAIEVAQVTTDSYFHATRAAPGGDASCSAVVGPAASVCDSDAQTASDVAKPITDALTNALIVKPYQLLQYGRILDPQVPDDQKAYAVHINWVSGSYDDKPSDDRASSGGPCRLLIGSAKDFCEKDSKNLHKEGPSASTVDSCSLLTGPAKDYCLSGTPPLPKGSQTEDLPNVLLSQGDGQDGFFTDLKAAGDVGKTCDTYAEDPTWSRVAGVLLLIVACIVAAAMVGAICLALLGSQAAEVAAAAFGATALVLGTLPGPPRTIVWRWLSVFLIGSMVQFIGSGFLPLFGIVVDVVLVKGPQLMVERLLLLDAVAIASLAFHRRLLAGANRFGQDLARRARFLRVGGTHLPGDSSELGAALSMNAGGGGGGGFGGGVARRAGPASPLAALLGQGGVISSLAEGSGGSRLLGDAGAGLRVGLAPLTLGAAGTAAAAQGLLGTAYGALIGQRPSDAQFARWNARVTRYDPVTGRPLPWAGIQNHAMRFRAFRVASRLGRFAYGSTWGLATRARNGGGRVTDATTSARDQLRYGWGMLRRDGHAWRSNGGTAAAGGYAGPAGGVGAGPGAGPTAGAPAGSGAATRATGRVSPADLAASGRDLASETLIAWRRRMAMGHPDQGFFNTDSARDDGSGSAGEGMDALFGDDFWAEWPTEPGPLDPPGDDPFTPSELDPFDSDPQGTPAGAPPGPGQGESFWDNLDLPPAAVTSPPETADGPPTASTGYPDGLPDPDLHNDPDFSADEPGGWVTDDGRWVDPDAPDSGDGEPS